MSAVLNIQSDPLLRSTVDERLSPGFNSRFGRILFISLVVHLFMLVIIKVNIDFEGDPAGPMEITLIPTMEEAPVIGRDIQTMIQEYLRTEDIRRWKKSSQPRISNHFFHKSSSQLVPQIQAHETSDGNIDLKFRSQSGKIYCFVIRRPDPLNAFDQGALYHRKC